MFSSNKLLKRLFNYIISAELLDADIMAVLGSKFCINIIFNIIKPGKNQVDKCQIMVLLICFKLQQITTLVVMSNLSQRFAMLQQTSQSTS